MAVENPCVVSPGDSQSVDTDGDGSVEVVYLRPANHADRFDLGLCIYGETQSNVTIDGSETTILGFVDLDDDGAVWAWSSGPAATTS